MLSVPDAVTTLDADNVTSVIDRETKPMAMLTSTQEAETVISHAVLTGNYSCRYKMNILKLLNYMLIN